MKIEILKRHARALLVRFTLPFVVILAVPAFCPACQITSADIENNNLMRDSQPMPVIITDEMLNRFVPMPVTPVFQGVLWDDATLFEKVSCTA